MTRWKFTSYSPSIGFEENVIYNNHISNHAKDFQKSVAVKAKREVGKGAVGIKLFQKALRQLAEKELIRRWTSRSFIHYSVLTEHGLDFKADTEPIEIWCSNKWTGLPEGFNDTLTFMILSSWRFDKHLRSQSIKVNLKTKDLARRFGGAWSEKEISKRIAFLQRNGNLNGDMLSELTFSPELEVEYQKTELR